MFDKDRLKSLDELINNEVKKGKLLGCSFALFENNEKIATKAYGSDSLDSIYKIYSMSKPITSVAAMMLYEKGLIDMFDPVYKYLPAYKDIKVAKGEGQDETLTDPERPILVKDLFNMTSGLPYPGEWSYAERRMEEIKDDLHKRAVEGANFTNIDIINEWAKAPLRFSPGEGWLYGTSADVLAGIVEVITGIPFGEFLKKNLFEPLKMEDTGFFVDPSKKDRLAKMYYIDDSTGILREATDHEKIWLNEYAPFEPPYIESGGGGLYSSLDDYSNFVNMLINEGEFNGHRILSPSTVRFMSMNQLTPKQLGTMYFEDLPGYGYGCLMRQLMDPAMQGTNSPAGEYGWDGLAGTYFFVDPVNKISFVCMQQIAQGADRSVRRRMKQIIYGSLC